MSSESITYYLKLLDDLKTFQLNLNDSDEANDTEVELNNFRRKLCECGKFYDDLNSSNCSYRLAEVLCELVAELAKDEQCRNEFIDNDYFIPLIKFLIDQKTTDLLKIQLCRTIGNLCYENDKSRLKFHEHSGMPSLINLCKYCTELNLTNSSNDQRTKIKLILVSLGCLHNVTNDNETLRKDAYDLNVMKLLKDYVKFLKYDLGILIHFGSCIENLIELDQGKEQFVSEKLALEIYKNLDSELIDDYEDYLEDLMRILSLINDLNMSREYLCETNFLEIIINYVEERLDNDDLTRSFGGFLTNLLCNDDKIDLLFEYRNGLILNKAIEWLDKFENEQLYLSSAVIIANYIRDDEKAFKMIQNKTHVKILNLLKKYNKFGTKATLQQINISHSLLSTFKNFCVPIKTRDELLKNDVIKVVIDYLNFDNLEVKWKALSIIRFLVKNCTEQTGLSQVFDDKLLERIESIANNPEDHPGVTGESSRLVCYLPIAAKSEKNIAKFCKYKFVNVICNQLKSEHIIMLNEALLALNVLLTVDYRACYDQLKEANLNEFLKELFNRTTIPFEILSNAISLFKYLFERNDFFTEEQLKIYLDLFKKIRLNTTNESFKNHLTQLIDKIENTI